MTTTATPHYRGFCIIQNPDPEFSDLIELMWDGTIPDTDPFFHYMEEEMGMGGSFLRPGAHLGTFHTEEEVKETVDFYHADFGQY